MICPTGFHKLLEFRQDFFIHVLYQSVCIVCKIMYCSYNNGIDALDIVSRFLTSGCQLANFGGNHCKSFSCIPGTGSLNGCV